MDAPIDVTPLAARATARGGSETVLLLEDEDAVRALAERILTQHGYRVLVAATPGEALDIAAGYKDSLHLLLSDMVLPEMSGPSLAEKLFAEQPGLPVLYMSGYTDHAIVHGGMLDATRRSFRNPSLRRRCYVKCEMCWTVENPDDNLRLPKSLHAWERRRSISPSRT